MSGATTEDYRGLWVFVEQRDGQPARVSLELLSAGRVLADKLGVEVTALLIGDGIAEIAQELISYGADRVIVAEDPVAKEYRTEVHAGIFVEQALSGKPEIVLIGATCFGRDLAPRIAARLRTGCTADCSELKKVGRSAAKFYREALPEQSALQTASTSIAHASLSMKGHIHQSYGHEYHHYSDLR